MQRTRDEKKDLHSLPPPFPSNFLSKLLYLFFAADPGTVFHGICFSPSPCWLLSNATFNFAIKCIINYFSFFCAKPPPADAADTDPLLDAPPVPPPGLTLTSGRSPGFSSPFSKPGFSFPFSNSSSSSLRVLAPPPFFLDILGNCFFTFSLSFLLRKRLGVAPQFDKCVSVFLIQYFPLPTQQEPNILFYWYVCRVNNCPNWAGRTENAAWPAAAKADKKRTRWQHLYVWHGQLPPPITSCSEQRCQQCWCSRIFGGKNSKLLYLSPFAFLVFDGKVSPAKYELWTTRLEGAMHCTVSGKTVLFTTYKGASSVPLAP